MNNRLNEIEERLNNSAIEKDAYVHWLENPVTQRFMLEIEQDLIMTQSDLTPSQRSTVERIALECVRNAEHCEMLAEILEWKPVELDDEQ